MSTERSMAEKLAVDSSVPRKGAKAWAACSWVQPRSIRALATLNATIWFAVHSPGDGLRRRGIR